MDKLIPKMKLMFRKTKIAVFLWGKTNIFNVKINFEPIIIWVEVNLRNLLHAGDKVLKGGDLP